MSSGSTHTGSITLDFKSEKSFKIFSYEWAKCNSHFQIGGEIKKPENTGKWQYSVPYKLDCGCESVLGNFQKAYEGAFKKKLSVPSREAVRFGNYSYDEAPLHSMDTSDYLAFLDRCGLPSRQEEMDSTFWNIALTNMIRRTNRAAWGNWALNPEVVPGAVGILDPVTGSFTQVAMIPNAQIKTFKSPQAWVIESSTVRRTETDIEFKGGYLDPSSGIEVTAGLDVSWGFASEGSLASNATITGESQVDNFGTVMADNYDWLLQRAREVGFATEDGIVQGFGMITKVQNCSGGINIGSLNEDSSLSLVGSVDGVNVLTGGDINAGVKGSYKEINETKAFESHIWPENADTTANGEVAISYKFASYDGKLIMPTWIKKLSGFSVTFDNQHGGTYIGHCLVKYDLTVNGEQTTFEKRATVRGGQTETLDDIPLDATNIQINIEFVAGSSFNHSFKMPLTDLLGGTCTVDMSGVWPFGSHAEIRITD